jgi:hypothetical protein
MSGRFKVSVTLPNGSRVRLSLSSSVDAYELADTLSRGGGSSVNVVDQGDGVRDIAGKRYYGRRRT